MAKNALKHSQRGADTFTRITVMGLTVLLLWGEVSRVEVGCSSFGHSCFGAHGKRAELPAGYNSNLDAMAMIAPVGSRLSPGGPSIPAEAISDNYDPNMLPLSSNSRISPYLMEWILSARRGDSRPLANVNPSADEMPSAYRRK